MDNIFETIPSKNSSLARKPKPHRNQIHNHKLPRRIHLRQTVRSRELNKNLAVPVHKTKRVQHMVFSAFLYHTYRIAYSLQDKGHIHLYITNNHKYKAERVIILVRLSIWCVCDVYVAYYSLIS